MMRAGFDLHRRDVGVIGPGGSGAQPVSPVARRRAFTLIELLTVIAIVSILAGLLFPVFAQAREKARQASCASNERQLAMAIQQYSQDNDEVLPQFSHGLGFQGSVGYLGADGPRWADMILPYVRSQQVFNCSSSSQRIAVFPGGTYFDTLTYSYGITVILFDLPPDSDYGAAGRYLAAIADASATIMLADDLGGPEHSGKVEVDSLDTPATLSAKLDGQRHARAAGDDYGAQAFNAAFVDGHVKFTRLTDTCGTQPSPLRPWRVNSN